MFSLERGNQIIFAVALASLFLLTYRSKNKLLSHVGCFALATAAVLKIWPCLFGILLIYEKRYKYAIITAIEAILLTILPFFLLNGNVMDNIRLCIEAIIAHAQVYGLDDNLLGINARTIFNITLNTRFLSYIMALISLMFAGSLKTEW